MTTIPEREGREGDSQPMPTASNTPHMHDLVSADLAVRDCFGDDDPVLVQIVADLAARKAVGLKRYGQPLQAFNGRDPILDAYEEALDMSVYLRQALWEAAGVTRSTRSLELAYDHVLDALANLRDCLNG